MAILSMTVLFPLLATAPPIAEPIAGDPLAQVAYLKPFATDPADTFGSAATNESGDTVVIGALNEDGGVAGVNGDPADNSAATSGAAYVFERSGSAWTAAAYLKASNVDASDAFGRVVAISGDTCVVGAAGEASAAAEVGGAEADNSAPHAGAAYVFVRSAGGWFQQAYLKASNAEAGDAFGWQVAIDGDAIVVTAVQESSSAVGVDGDGSVNGANLSGAAYVFRRSDGGTPLDPLDDTWAQEAYLKPSNTGAFDRFGSSVDISGDTVVIGAQAEDSVATGVNGDGSDDSGFNTGAAYVFRRAGGVWAQEAYLKPPVSDDSDLFGGSVAIEGNVLVVGASQEDGAATGVSGDPQSNGAFQAGAAFVFERSGSDWSQTAYLKASNTGPGDRFGVSVALSGDLIAVAANEEDGPSTGVNGSQGNGAQQSGAAYVFGRQGASWVQHAYVKTSNAAEFDNAGFSLALGGTTLVMGASGEDGAGNGVVGDPLDNSANSSGAAYVFEAPCATLAASEVAVRAGSPPNPLAFLPGATVPAIGTVWSPVVDHSSFVANATADFLVATPSPTNVFIGAPGTLLCDLAAAPLVLAFAPSPGTPFGIPLPSPCSWSGVSFCAQAGSVDPAGAAHLTNALDVTIGAY